VPEANRDRPFRVHDPETGLPDGDPGILLGLYLADQLQVRRGDHLTLSTAKIPEGGFTGSEEVDIRTERVVVAGCFETGRYDYDSAMAFCEIGFLNELMGQSGDCAEIHCRIEDPERANLVKEELIKNYGGAIDVTTWIDRMGPLAEALDVEKGVMMIIMFFIVLVAGASILGILYMLVSEKTRDIGILLSMGATPGGITMVFLLYGGLLGALGTGLGTLFGLEVVWNINAITAFLDQSLGIEVFPARIYQFNQLPTQVNPSEITTLAVSTFCISILAAFLPALRAARLNPVKCLSYE
jgi:lipoprotein-releasing system permease protein